MADELLCINLVTADEGCSLKRDKFIGVDSISFIFCIIPAFWIVLGIGLLR